MNFIQCDLEFGKSRREEEVCLEVVHIAPPPCMALRGRPGTGLARRVDHQADGERRRAGRRASLDDLEVVQDGHDVLRHEDVAGVHSHGSHRDEQRV